MQPGRLRQAVGSRQLRCQEPEIRKQNGRLDSSGFGLVDLVCGSSLINADSREFWGSLISEHWKPSMTSLVPLLRRERTFTLLSSHSILSHPVRGLRLPVLLFRNHMAVERGGPIHRTFLHLAYRCFQHFTPDFDHF